MKFLNPSATLYWNIRSNIIDTNVKITKNTTKFVIALLSKLSWIPKKIFYNSLDSKRNHELYGFNGHSEIFHNFCDREIFFKRDSNFNQRFKKRLGLPLDQKIILFVGRDHSVKNFKLFKETAKKMSKNKLFIFISLGIKEKHDEQHNLFCFRSSKSPQYFYSISDILFQTSLSESFPNALLEASVSNCLLLASDVGDSSLLAHYDFMFDPQKPNDYENIFYKILSMKKEVIIEQNKKNKNFRKEKILDEYNETKRC